MKVKNKNLMIKNRRAVGRKARVRAKINGTSVRPRVSTFFSNKNILVQLIDDESGKTLAAVSTLDKKAGLNGNNRESAKKIGEMVADKAKGLGLTEAVFDRGSRRYHGKVKDLAEAIREKGLKL